MAKLVEYDSEIRQKLLAGATKLSRAVGVTLGPKGRNVLLEKGYGHPTVTKDGVTVAKDIDLSDPFENMGAKMVREVAAKTNDVAGDGTTTATILAEAIFRDGIKLVTAGHNSMDLKRGIDQGVAAVTKVLEELSRDVTENSEVAQVGTISANGDTAIGNIIAEAMERVGKEGVITVEEGKGMETTLEVVEGMQFDRGYIAHWFMTDADRLEAVLDKPYILLFEKKISSLKPLVPTLEFVIKQQRPLLIIAEDVEGEALATLIVNKMRGTMQVCAVKSPGFGDRRKDILGDIAILTGGEIVSEDLGTRLDQGTHSRLGQCESVIVTKDSTTIIDGAGNLEEIKARVNQLRVQIEEARGEFDREKLQERLAKLAGGVAVISVGAATEVELREKKDRVEDALHATRAAVLEGILPGGGLAYVRSLDALSELRKQLAGTEVEYGVQILESALLAPIKLIAENAGENGAVVVKEVQALEGNIGYNAATGVYEDLMAAGVVDPTKVSRTALQNAASVASLLLTTEAAVCTDPESMQSMPSGMGGMGGMM